LSDGALELRRFRMARGEGAGRPFAVHQRILQDAIDLMCFGLAML
jgi:hypothetical protein